MNVTFHTIAGIATAAALSFKQNEIKRATEPFVILRCIVGFLIGILIHGTLDFLPHEYPLRPYFDVLFALFLLAVTFVLMQKQNRLLLVSCFLGSIFPDLVDLSSAVLNKHLNIPILQPYKIFPWHWKDYSGSIYDGSRRAESMLYHAILLALSGFPLYFNRKRFFNFDKVSK